jgi:TRAP-type C4-dicarboxylate transport system permease small subunit
MSTPGTVAGRIEAAIHAASKAISYVSGVALVLMVIAVLVDVITREIGASVPGNIDIAELLLVLVAYLAIPYTYAIKGHIRVDLVYRRLSPRVKGILDSITHLLAIGAYGFIVWAMADRAWSIFTSAESEPLTLALEIPIVPFFIVIAFATLLLCLELLVDFTKAIVRAAGR